jgi:hypothetical protein
MLNRSLIALSLALGLTGAVETVAAQQGMLPGKRVSFGLLVGASAAKVGGSDVSDIDVGTRNGLVGGVSLGFRVSKLFSIEPELLYDQKGSKNDLGDDLQETLKLDYLEMPVLARVDLPVAGIIRPFFVAGPAFGFQLKCNYGLSDGSSSVSASCEDALEGTKAKSVDVGATAGVGIAMPMGRQSFSLSARYTHGLSDTFDQAHIKNRSLALLAGISF